MKLSNLLNLIPATTVYAHCDVPCGVYETDTLRNAAFTVSVMTDKLKNQTQPAMDDEAGWMDYRNATIRMVTTKDQHAQMVKDQLFILWADFFKPENAPEGLHEKIWQTAKLASKTKQHVDPQACKDLIAAVMEIIELFNAAKAAAK